MKKKSKNEHTHIEEFHPIVMSLRESYQKYIAEMELFDAGNGYENFNEFVHKEAIDYTNAGDGVTYVVWDVFYDEEHRETERHVVAFYTLATTAIPYEDRIRLDDEEAKMTGREFGVEICGISAIEIKMFAVDERYQDRFYIYEDEDLPISAWIVRFIVDYAHNLLNDIVGFKALFLHSLPEAESFYKENGFKPLEINMQPLHCLDSEFKAMYLPLKEVHMNYDK